MDAGHQQRYDYDDDEEQLLHNAIAHHEGKYSYTDPMSPGWPGVHIIKGVPEGSHLAPYLNGITPITTRIYVPVGTPPKMARCSASFPHPRSGRLWVQCCLPNVSARVIP
jgi:hypothetical protein